MTTPPPVASRRSLVRRAAVAGTAGTLGAIALGLPEVAQGDDDGLAARRRPRGKGKSKGKRKGKCRCRSLGRCRCRTRGKGTGKCRCQHRGKCRCRKRQPGNGPPDQQRTPQLLGASDRHLVTRFSYGLTPDLGADALAAGGARKWFEKQLAPASVPDAAADALLGWWPSLSRGAQDLWQRQVQDVEGGWEVMEDYQRWLLVRRMRTQRQVAEVMTEFWQNHLNVPANGDAAFTYRTDYDRRIRAGALGRFEDLLQTAVTHPAMGIYLDNAVSTAEHPNENLGRELLELHTVGRGGYTEDDVKNSGRILTGWTVDLWRTWSAAYSPEDHWRGPVRVMGFSDPNAAADGRAVTTRYLSYLARHPRTAQRIALKLAIKFVRDNPPPALVDRLAQVYLANDTEIKPVLRALVDSVEFKGSAGLKVRDPGEDLVATYRVLGVTLQRPPASYSGDAYAVEAALWQARDIGTAPFGWPRPDGQPVDNDSWSSPARLVASMSVHFVMSGGWWPDRGITYRKPMAWMPARDARLDTLVDHMSRLLLHRPADAQLEKACSQAVDLPLSERIDADHGLIQWYFARLLSTFLDSPTHLTK